VPDLDVRVLRRLGRTGVDGLLGLDFLIQYDEVHFLVATRRLVLIAPKKDAI
jgi:hypothetical protein